MDKDNVFCSNKFWMSNGDKLHVIIKDLVGTMPTIELYDEDGNTEDVYYGGDPVIKTHDVLFNTPDIPTQVYLYDVAAKESTLLDIPNITAQSMDIAHTETKLWLHNGHTVDEWDITLTPASFIYNRNVTNVIRNSGLGCKDNTTLLNVKWIGIDPDIVIEEDITGAASIATEIFPIMAGRFVSGDFLLTTTNKFIITTMSSTDPYPRYISQFDYTTGVQEFDIQISPSINYPYGIFMYEGEIYIAATDSTSTFGEIWHMQKVAPYALTLYDTTDYKINGASQVPEQLTVHFT